MSVSIRQKFASLTKKKVESKLESSEKSQVRSKRQGDFALLEKLRKNLETSDRDSCLRCGWSGLWQGSVTCIEEQ